MVRFARLTQRCGRVLGPEAFVGGVRDGEFYSL
jgi:hypothetical protein